MRGKLPVALLIAALVGVPLLLQGVTRQQPRRVTTETVEPRALRPSVLASGMLEFRERADLSPEVLAKVSQILVKEGDRVVKGQPVMRLDSTGIEAEVEQREAAARQQEIAIERYALDIRLLRKQLDRLEQLHARKLVDDAALDDKRTALEKSTVDLAAARQALVQASAALRQARDALSKTAIVSPIDGTVTVVGIKVGETAVPSSVGVQGSKLMSVADTATIMAKVAVDEADIGRVALGQDVSIFPAASSDAALAGRVTLIPLSPTEPAANARTATRAKSYSVEVDFDADARGTTLRPGMTCRAEIVVATAARVLAVPQQAVLDDAERRDDDARDRDAPDAHYVFVVENGRAVRRAVTAGLSDDAYWELTSGVAAGDRVIVGPYKVLRHLRAGDRVADAPEA
ncbi:MAG TPA: efflux RND transporter periplasmic adaptor subunit [Tahibacter sp.]|nr:efflux RND transporter periplasmic adaptor subunit [Tahibacter sp.]